MRRSLTPARTLATTSVVTGATLLGWSLGGMAGVDRDLAAATPAPAVQVDRVVFRDQTGHADHHRGADNTLVGPEL
jgi:hypothetical protein